MRDKFTDELIKDAMDGMKVTRATLGDVVKGATARLYHGTRGPWTRRLAGDKRPVVPRKTAAACAASRTCARGHGGTFGYGQYFSTSLKDAALQGRGSEEHTVHERVTVLRVDVAGATCNDGTAMADLVGVRMARPLEFGCMFCFPADLRDWWSPRVVRFMKDLSRRVDFIYQEPGYGAKSYEIMFTNRGLARGIPVAAMLNSRGTPAT